MTTGQQYVKFFNKSLLGFGDWGTRFHGYLRQLAQDVTKAHWDVDGVFNVALTLSGPAANTVRINGTSRATEGSGHILDIDQAFTRDCLFQNTSSVLYYVGMYYAEVPDDVRVSPRNGLPQYLGWKEHVGRAGTPNSVVDNGNGTMTFIVDSVTEVGVSNAGRSVLVYKISPAPNATTTAVAIETKAVSWDGTNNKITTTGIFGQSGSPSTTAADYVVVLLGPSVSRNTDLRTEPNVCFIGTVTGNGGTPGTFSTADQRILKTFQDATQIVYTPHNWIGATNVGAALDEIADDLSSNNATTPGAALVGIDPTDFDSQAYNSVTVQPEFGIGIVESGGFASNAKVQDAFIQIEKILKRRVNWRTHSDASFPADSESVDLGSGTLGVKNDGRLVLLRKLANQATTPYTITSGGSMTDNEVVRVISESTDYGLDTNPNSRKTRVLVSGTDTKIVGHWQGVWFDASGADYWTTPYTGGHSFASLEDFELTGGHILVQDTSHESLQTIRWANGIVRPKSEATVGQAYSLALKQLGGVNLQCLRGTFQDMIVYGPHSSQTTPSPLGALNVEYLWGNFFGEAGGTPEKPSQPLVFERCVFIQQRTGVGLINVAGKQGVIFRDCYFVGMAASTANLVTIAANAQAHFERCTFYDPEGVGTFTATSGANVTVTDCDFVAGFGGSGTAADPRIVRVYGSSLGAFFTDCRFYLGDRVTRDTGSTNPLLDFGIGSGEVGVKGLRILVEKNAGSNRLHLTGILRFQGSGAVGRVYASDVLVNLGGGCFPPGATAPMVNIIQATVQGLRLVNWSLPGSGVSAGGIQLSTMARLRDVSIETPATGLGSTIGFLLSIQSDSVVDGVQLQNLSNVNVTSGVIVDAGSGPATLRGLRSSSGLGFTAGKYFNFTDASARVYDCHFNTSAAAPSGHYTINGRDSHIGDSHFLNLGASAITISGGRRIKFHGNTVHYDGTTAPPINISSNDSLIRDNLAYRSAGAQGLTADSGTGNSIGDNILSTTL